MSDQVSPATGVGGSVVFTTSTLVHVLSGKLRRQLDEELAPRGLSLRRYTTLGHIEGSPGMSYSELARRSDVTVQTMFRHVRALEADGLVGKQERPPSKGSPVGLALTEAGRAALHHAQVADRHVDERALAALEPQEAAVLTELVWRLLRPTGDS